MINYPQINLNFIDDQKTKCISKLVLNSEVYKIKDEDCRNNELQLEEKIIELNKRIDSLEEYLQILSKIIYLK